MATTIDIMKTAIVIDTVGLSTGSALVYARGHARIDGRLGKDGKRWYFETYNSSELGLTDQDFGKVIGYGATRTAAVNKVIKELGLNPNDFRFVYER